MKFLWFHSSLQLIQQVPLQQWREACFNVLIQLGDGLIDSHAPLITSQISLPSWQASPIFLLLLLLLILGFQPAGAQSRATCPLPTFCILWSAFPWAKTFSCEPPSLAPCHLACGPWREISWCSCTCVSGTLGHHGAVLGIFKVGEGALWGLDGQVQEVTQNFRSVHWIFLLGKKKKTHNKC